MFSTFFSPTHGNCFTFNYGVGKEERNLVKSYKSGRQFGKATTKILSTTSLCPAKPVVFTCIFILLHLQQ